MRSLGFTFLATFTLACTSPSLPFAPMDERPSTLAPSTRMEVTAAPDASATASPPVEGPKIASPRPDTKQTLMAESGHIVEVYPPLDKAAQADPLVVFLHATCMQPADVCDFWSKGGRDASWLVCPAGPSVCYGAPDWSGPPALKADTLASAISAVDSAFPQWVDHEKGNVLIGYSRGGFAARDILYERPGMFHGLIILSAAVKLDPAKLKAAGIRRAVFATGDLDGSRPTMKSTMRLLEASGIPSKFVSLGKIGHWLPNDLEPIMRDAIAWVETPES